MRLAPLIALLALPALAEPVTGLAPERFGLADEGAPREGPPAAEGAPLRTVPFDAPPALWARSVGRLDVLAEGAVTRCTGFAAAPDLLLTGPDCVPEGAERAVLLMGHDGLGPVRRIALPPKPVERGLGFALLSLPPGALPALRLSEVAPGPAEALVLLGHPGGGPLRMARMGCRAGHQPISDGRLTHRCAPALAGAPLFDPRTGAVVGMHDADGPPGALGFAVPMGAILSASEALGGGTGRAPGDVALLAGLCAALREAPEACTTWEAAAFCGAAPACEPEAVEAAGAGAPPLPFAVREGVDLPGGDLGDAAYEGLALSDCEAACRAEPACAAFALRAGICRLKARRSEPVPAPGAISGWPASAP